MNKLDIQTVKANIERKVVIDHININLNEKPYIWFSDCDSMTDYYHGRNITLKELPEELKTRGADVIRVTTDYQSSDDVEGKDLEKIIRKVNKVAKESGYRNLVKIENRYYDNGYARSEWKAAEGTFVRQFEALI